MRGFVLRHHHLDRLALALLPGLACTGAWLAAGVVGVAMAGCAPAPGSDGQNGEGSGGNRSGNGTGGAATGPGAGGRAPGGTGGTGGKTGGGGSTGGGSGSPGVVIDRTCYALCTMTTMGSAANPDWGYENNASCVIPKTQTAVAAPCTTGQPLPPDPTGVSAPGVVLGSTCYPLCMVAKTGTTKTPDWNYENGGSCVVPGTHTAVAQMCMTGQPLPDPALLCGRSGVVVLDSANMNARMCAPSCTYSTNPAADPEMDDWDYEYNASCVIPTSPTSLNQACKTCATVPGPVAKPGVVVVNGAGTAQCTPLCQINVDPAKDPQGDGWAYEDNSSCVIPNTAAALTNLKCTTTQPIPMDTPRPGVEVTGKSGALQCAALCTFYKMATQDGANDDGLADDWAWENSAPCIIPNTVTAKANTSCMTLMPLPTPAPRPGIMVNSDPVQDSCKTSACVPLCRVVTKPSNTTYPDWGWEDNNSCVLPGTPTATVLPKSMENQGYAVPPRKCTWGMAVPNFMMPPKLDTARNVNGGHFLAKGTQLLDPYNQPFLIRGVNNSHAWYDICGQYSAYEALDNIAARGANAVRVGWAFQSIDPGGPGGGDPQKNVIGTNPQLLAEILYRIVELKMIPILAVNDTTGQTATGEPRRMAQFMIAPGYKEVLMAYQPYLLIGIANEWNGVASSFYGAYNDAVQLLRTNGFNHTLVITGNDWGQGCDALLTDGPRLTTADPLHNLIFDVHIYEYLTYMGGHGGTAQIVQGCMDSAVTAGIPLLVGEFGNTHGGVAVQYQTVITRANANKQGYTPWLWYGDTEYPALNMNTTWEGPLTSWGTAVGALGGTKATIFP